MKRSAEEHLRASLESMAVDVFDEIKDIKPSAVESEEELFGAAEIKNKDKNKATRFGLFLRYGAAVAAVVACFLMVNGLTTVARDTARLYLDVNPGICIDIVRESGETKVTDVTAVNDDAEKIVSELSNTEDLNILFDEILQSLKKYDYITEDKRTVLISYSGKSSGRLADEVDSDVETWNEESNLNIIYQKIEAGSDEESEATEYGLSPGKYIYVQSVAEENDGLSFEDIYSETIEEISRLAESTVKEEETASYDSEEETTESLWSDYQEDEEETIPDQKSEIKSISDNDSEDETDSEDDAANQSIESNTSEDVLYSGEPSSEETCESDTEECSTTEGVQETSVSSKKKSSKKKKSSSSNEDDSGNHWTFGY